MNPVEIARKYDITMKMAPFMDRHLLLPQLNFLYELQIDGKQVFSQEEINKARFEVAKGTNVLDSVVAFAAPSEKDAVAADVEEKRTAVLGRHKQLLTTCSKIISDFFNKSEHEELSLRVQVSDLESQKSLGKLGADVLGYKEKVMAAFYELGYQLFDAGCYDQASAVLQLYLMVTDRAGDSSANDLSAAWGKLVSDLLIGYYDSAQKDIEALRSRLELHGTTLQRAWLLHWSLFYYFGRQPHTSWLVDHIFQDPSFTYYNVMQASAPHLLRYVVAALVINKRKRGQMRKLQRLVEQEVYNYSDPFTQFIDALYGQANYEAAQELLKSCDVCLQSDYFLKDYRDEFMTNARHLVYEDYLRVHSVLSINTVAEQLGMTPEKAEVWLVNLIRDSKADAMVDSVSGTVRIAPTGHQRSVWQNVLEKLESADRASASAF